MAEVLDWRGVGRPEAVVRFVVSALRQGHVVAFPTETTYLAAASAVRPGAVDRLRPLGPLELAVAGPAAANDWLPRLGTAGRRLTRRLWPGPLLLLSDEGSDEGPARRLPAPVRQALGDGPLRLRQPGHELLTAVVRQAGFPVVGAALAAGDVRAALQEAGGQLDLALADAPCRYGRPATEVRAAGDNWSIVRQGVLSDGQIREQLCQVIVFICTGNTCRSPMAEAICKQVLAARLGCRPDELPGRGWLILSAGLAAGPGLPAAEQAVDVAQALGADLSGHQSRPLWPDLVARADYLVAMTAGHVRGILDQFPPGTARPRLLDPEGGDVDDPVGQSLEVYQACAAQLTAHIDRLVDELVGPAAR